jgi:uncharacterized membrane protein
VSHRFAIAKTKVFFALELATTDSPRVSAIHRITVLKRSQPACNRYFCADAIFIPVSLARFDLQRGKPMRNAASMARQQPHSIANTALKSAATFWFVVAASGQLLFAFYIAVFYGGSAVRGDLASWSKVLPRGVVAGDTAGNFFLALHLLLALMITVAGVLQLVPQIRARVPVFHRWNGRTYVVVAFIAALSGLYLLWVRGTVGDTGQHLGTTLNSLLILLCAVMTFRYAVARDFTTHRRWALRLFLVVGGVWFFRVGLMLWLLIFQAPVGFDDKTFTGPFLTILTFAQTLIPLAMLELYLRAQRSASEWARASVAGILFVLTIAMGVGIFGAAMGMWLPRV